MQLIEAIPELESAKERDSSQSVQGFDLPCNLAMSSKNSASAQRDKIFHSKGAERRLQQEDGPLIE